MRAIIYQEKNLHLETSLRKETIRFSALEKHGIKKGDTVSNAGIQAT